MTAVLNRVGLLAAIAALLFLPARAFAASANHNPFEGIAVSGTSQDGNVFKGTMDVLGFVNDNGVLKAISSLNGTITSAAGVATQVAGAVVAVPVAKAMSGAAQTGFGGMAAAASTSCQILNLDLGPLDLNLLGLTVHLNEVVLNVAAQPGPGNLLGNLLCAVANLLNGANIGALTIDVLNAVAVLLNNLLLAL
jgi:hypothetical protein